MSTFHSYNFSDGAGLSDASGNTLLQFDTNANAVNNLQIANTATGSNVVVSVVGSDNNVGLDLLPKNGGNVNIMSTSTQGGLRFYRGTDSQASGFVGLTGPSSGDNTVYTLPAEDGSNGQFLKTNGSGVLSFTDGGGVGGSSTTEILFNNAGSVDGVETFTTAGGNLTFTGTLNLNSTGTSNVYVDSSGLRLGSTEAITAFHSDSEGFVVTNGTTANIALVNDSNTITSDGTDLTISAGNAIILNPFNNIEIGSGKKIQFADSGEYILGNGTDLTVASGGDINLTATSNVNIPSGVNLVFGPDTHNIEHNGFDLAVASSSDIVLSATGDVVVSGTSKLEFNAADSGEHITGDGTNLTVASGGDINLTATGDVVVSGTSKLEFNSADSGEHITGDGSNLSIVSGNVLNLTPSATSNVVLTQGNFVMSSETLGNSDFDSNSSTPGSIHVKNSVSYIYLTGSTPLYGTVANNPSSNGAIWHVLFAQETSSTATLRIDFGNDGLASGSGLAQYLTFGVDGQSASMLYMHDKWRIINTGASVS